MSQIKSDFQNNLKVREDSIEIAVMLDWYRSKSGSWTPHEVFIADGKEYADEWFPDWNFRFHIDWNWIIKWTLPRLWMIYEKSFSERHDLDEDIEKAYDKIESGILASDINKVFQNIVIIAKWFNEVGKHELKIELKNGNSHNR